MFSYIKNTAGFAYLGSTDSKAGSECWTYTRKLLGRAKYSRYTDFSGQSRVGHFGSDIFFLKPLLKLLDIDMKQIVDCKMFPQNKFIRKNTIYKTKNHIFTTFLHCGVTRDIFRSALRSRSRLKHIIVKKIGA